MSYSPRSSSRSKKKTLNHERVGYPSDQITLRGMRLRQPKEFLAKELRTEKAIAVEPLAILLLEQILAEKAFADAIHEKDPYPQDKRDEVIKMIHEGYLHYQVSSGMWQTTQLIESFEAQAREQSNITCSQSR